MPLIQQNFSMTQGDDTVIMLDIDPDVDSMIGTDLTFRAYAQEMAVPLGDAVLTKDLDDGLQITDPDYGEVLITFVPDDTIEMAPGNYCYEITTYDIDEKRVTVTYGIMTLTRTKNPEALE